MYVFLLHCSPETGIMLLIIEGGLFIPNHPSSFALSSSLSLLFLSTSPRDSSFKAASFPSQAILADNGPGGRAMRCLALTSRCCRHLQQSSSFIILWCRASHGHRCCSGHRCSLILFTLSQIIAVVVLILPLPPKITPIPDLETRPRGATMTTTMMARASIHARGPSLLARQGQLALIPPLRHLAPQQHQRCNLRHVQHLLKVADVHPPLLFPL
jgi:hypothetical protein